VAHPIQRPASCRPVFFIEDPNLLTPETQRLFGGRTPWGALTSAAISLCAPLPGEAKPSTDSLRWRRTRANSMGQLDGWTDQPLEVTRIEYKGRPAINCLEFQPPSWTRSPNDQWSYRFFFPLGKALFDPPVRGRRPAGVRRFGNRHDTSEPSLRADSQRRQGKASVYANEAIRDQTHCGIRSTVSPLGRWRNRTALQKQTILRAWITTRGRRLC